MRLMILSKRLKKLLKEKNISAKQLALDLNVKYYYILRVTNGYKIPYYILVKIIKHFNVTANYLLGLD